MAKAKKRICEVDFDSSYYIGSEEDGLYFDAAKGRGGWFMSADYDLNSGANACGDMINDEGPYKTQREALEAGLNAGIEWCSDNGVRWIRQSQQLRKRFPAEGK